MPPELLKTFDMTLLEPQEKIPHGNASCVAFMNYVYRTLQMMICESDMLKHQLMWDPMETRLFFLARISHKPSYFLQCDMEDECTGCMVNDEYSKVARFVQGFA